MKFFGGSKKPSSKKHHSSTPSFDAAEDPDALENSHSEPSSPSKSSRHSPKKSSRPTSYIDSPPKHPRPSRASRHLTDPSSSSSSSRRKKLDLDTHPLNLPPEERKRLSALSRSAMSGRNSMDIDQEPPVNGDATPEPPNASAQTNFAVPISNGTNHEENEPAPTPPPHKTNPSSPQPTPADEAESYKAAGNRFFKEKNYAKAIEQYSKGLQA
jgi:DnaJ homolog subfamily C member 7